MLKSELEEENRQLRKELRAESNENDRLRKELNRTLEELRQFQQDERNLLINIIGLQHREKITKVEERGSDRIETEEIAVPDLRARGGVYPSHIIARRW